MTPRFWKPVRVGPGQSAVTVTPVPCTSLASARDLCRDLIDGARPRKVLHDHHRLEVMLAFDPGRQLFQLVLAAGNHDAIEAVARKQQGQLVADPARGAGDDGPLAQESPVS